MANSVQTREIDGITFEVRRLPLKPSRDTLLKLTKMASPALAEFIRTGQGALGMASGVARLLATLEPSDLDELCSTFAAVTRVKVANAFLDLGAAGDSIFADNVATQLAWLAFALEVNFAEYLKGETVTSFLQSFKPKAASK